MSAEKNMQGEGDVEGDIEGDVDGEGECEGRSEGEGDIEGDIDGEGEGECEGGGEGDIDRDREGEGEGEGEGGTLVGAGVKEEHPQRLHMALLRHLPNKPMGGRPGRSRNKSFFLTPNYLTE